MKKPHFNQRNQLKQVYMIKVSLEVHKIDKSKMKDGKNGAKYLDIVIDTMKQPDAYGNTHTVYENQTKEEREAKKPKNYIGKGKEFVFNNQHNPSTAAPQSGYSAPPVSNNSEPVDDLPF